MKALITAYLVGILAGIVAGIAGWILNIVKLVELFGGPVTGKLVLRAVGIFAFPLGAVLGFVS
jgi:hypothetical protein